MNVLAFAGFIGILQTYIAINSSHSSIFLSTQLTSTMKTHISIVSIACMLVFANSSHGMALREGIEGRKDTSKTDGVKMDSSAKFVKSLPVSRRNLMENSFSIFDHEDHSAHSSAGESRAAKQVSAPSVFPLVPSTDTSSPPGDNR